jgi:site-specific recombinase XerD
MTIQESIQKFLEYCEITKNQSSKTIENYSHYLGRFLEFLGRPAASKNSITQNSAKQNRPPSD